MSIARGNGGQSTAYDDLEVQNVHLRRVVEPADLPLNGVITWDRPIEIAGGLSRGEIAELVCLHVHNVSPVIEPAGGGTSSDGNVECDLSWQLTLDNDGDMTDEQYRTVEDGEFADSRLKGNRYESYDPSNLYSVRIDGSYGPWQDTASGNGGGGSIHSTNALIPFRDLFGQGPTMDRHNEFTDSGQMAAANMTGARVGTTVAFTAYWDIQEAGDLR